MVDKNKVWIQTIIPNNLLIVENLTLFIDNCYFIKLNIAC